MPDPYSAFTAPTDAQYFMTLCFRFPDKSGLQLGDDLRRQARACSSAAGSRLMAPTRRGRRRRSARICGQMCAGSAGAHGFEPTDILVRKAEGHDTV